MTEKPEINTDERVMKALAKADRADWEKEHLYSTLSVAQWAMYGAVFLLLIPVLLFAVGLEKALVLILGGAVLLTVFGLRVRNKRRELVPGPDAEIVSGRLPKTSTSEAGDSSE